MLSDSCHQALQLGSQRGVQRQVGICRRRLAATHHRAQARALEGRMQPGQAVQLAGDSPQAVLAVLWQRCLTLRQAGSHHRHLQLPHTVVLLR